MPSKVIVIGGSGLIGSHVVQVLKDNGYEVQVASRHSNPAVDMSDAAAVETFFAAAGPFDHVVVAAGDAAFAPLAELDAAKLMVGAHSKLMGQLNVALAALKHMSGKGSVTLTSGVLAEQPIPGTAGIAYVNGAINSFVKAAALDLDESGGGRRINVVSPGWIKETLERMGMDSTQGMPAAEVAKLYLKSLEGDSNGEVIRA